ncbi:SIR2 family NAD-dependent protein deacylase [Thermosediminibacter litoriperuensis]|uniref:SIR2 family NAD-dependent protein deacylase n=1 Tax=Thermosediminibacter litoriperuensis TaxID=291989 RepID=UPI001FE5F087|nr:Sir2 family NAD-dependent protein deacetylase [Thermosediminibacter litoriperuensis]
MLTGAGISTESGIPDYRSKGTGLWERYDPIQKASLSALISNPTGFINFNIPRWTRYLEAEPNTAHLVIASMENQGLIEGVITQNIDGLHVKAGSKNVWEVHGHLRTCHCMECGRSYPFQQLTGQFEKGINPPRCERCMGMLRPDVVLFEDPMGRDYYRALEALKGCELLIVVGSSLQVYPVADMPKYAEKLIIVNKEPTPWDHRANLVFHSIAGEFFAELAKVLNLE